MPNVAARRYLQLSALAVLALLAACTGGRAPAGPTFAQVAAQVPPAPPDRARIFFYRDYEPYGRTVASLSLLSAYVMDFRHGATQRKERLLLQRRSLIVLSDEARYEWEHGSKSKKKKHTVKTKRKTK